MGFLAICECSCSCRECWFSRRPTSGITHRVLLLLGVSPLDLESSAELKLGRKTRWLGQGNPTEGTSACSRTRRPGICSRARACRSSASCRRRIWNSPGSPRLPRFSKSGAEKRVRADANRTRRPLGHVAPDPSIAHPFGRFAARRSGRSCTSGRFPPTSEAPRAAALVCVSDRHPRRSQQLRELALYMWGFSPYWRDPSVRMGEANGTDDTKKGRWSTNWRRRMCASASSQALFRLTS